MQFTVTAVVSPSVSVTPASGQRGTTFTEPGTGFTPNGSVVLHFQQPDGTEAVPIAKVADSNGSYSHSYASTSSTAVGTWSYWAVDAATGSSSSHVQFSVSP